MRRRQFLATGTAALTVAIAGCGHPPVVLDMNEASADDITDEVSMAVEPGSEEYTLVSAALENGSATRSGRSELFDRTDTVRFDDAFYDVSETRLETSEMTVYDVRIDFNPDDSTPELGEVDYDDLPEVDRQRLGRIGSEYSPPTQDGYEMGVDYGTAEGTGNESAFVPEQQYDIVVHDGNRYRIAVDSQTVSGAEYRYEVTEVAAGVEPFADRIREQYRFTLTGLSDAEREVVEEAIDGGYFEDDDAFQSMIDRIRERTAIHVEEYYGTWLIEYENVEYLTYAEW
jgi:hypothetical protein